MYKVYQLLNMVNAEYPNNGYIYEPEVNFETHVPETMINYINEALNRSFKEIQLDGIFSFPAIEGQAIYELPLDCDLSQIAEVTRTPAIQTKSAVGEENVVYYGRANSSNRGFDNTIRLTWARDAEQLDGQRYYNGWDNNIGIFPTPRSGEIITIYYKKKPKMVQIMDDKLEVKDRWISILKYDICASIAKSGSNPDIELSNNFTLQYNALIEEAKRSKYADMPFYPHTKDNAPSSVRYRRRWIK